MADFDKKANELSNELKARIGLAKSFRKLGSPIKVSARSMKKGAKARALKERC